MLDQKRGRLGAARVIRLLQLLFLSIALWFIYWAHIYEMIYWDKTFLESIQSNPINVLMYSVSIIVVISLELGSKRPRQTLISSSSVKSVEELQKGNEQMKYELQRSRKLPSNKIGITLLGAGALLLVASVVASSEILTFMGLGLTLWGVLFLFVRSTKFVRISILNAAATSPYITLDRIIAELNYKGKPIYIPPYPKDTYLPEHLTGLKDMVIFISAKDSATMPNLEEMAKKRFMVKNPEGICITPPGYSLVNLFEKELEVDLTKIDKDSFYEDLPIVITNNLELASNLEIKEEKQGIYVKITDSVYKHLYSKKQNIKTIHSIGCPLTSAITCALTIKTGKPITITKSKISPNLKTIEIWYQLLEG